MKILGISAYYHDAAAAILQDGNIVAAAQEERFTRKKHDASFPENAIRFCLDYSGIALDELDAIAFYDKPLLKFERLLETYYNFAPKGVRSFLRSMPIWAKEKLFLKSTLKKELKQFSSSKKLPTLLFPSHHVSHAASAFYPSAFEESAILTIDGVGEWATASISMGSGRTIKLLKELRFPHSLGLLYSAFTYFLGFRVNSGEYKLMGLAPYGNPSSPQVEEFVSIIENNLVSILPDGSIWLDQSYFDYATGLKMVNEEKWAQLFGFPARKPEAPLSADHCNLALAIQKVTEKIVLLMAKEAKRLTGSEHLCMAGGVALNCVANGKLLQSGIFKQIFIQPAAGDAGGALGAALAAYHLYFEKEREFGREADNMKGSYLGPEFSHLDIERTARKFGAIFEKVPEEELYHKVALTLNEGKVIGWFQGRMEFGPRALGNRSILGDARNPEMQKTLNLKIKYRESFRPFAPAVLSDDANEFFELPTQSPYMLLVDSIKEIRKKALPANYDALPLKQRLAVTRSDIPAVTHIDFSARIQTVHQETNERFHRLLKAFRALTGYGLLVNTSFNVRGEPIVCTPDDAFRCFLNTEMDYLVLGNYVFDKKDQKLSGIKPAEVEQYFELD